MLVNWTVALPLITTGLFIAAERRYVAVEFETVIIMGGSDPHMSGSGEF
jgi:hypothetical protein